MATTLVDYSDLDSTMCSTEQYRDNLYYQIHDPSLSDNLSINELERIIDLRDRPVVPKFIPGEMNPLDLQNLPNDIQWFIWKIFYTKNVIEELHARQDFIWRNPSENLKNLCKDKGCIQQGYHCLEEMIEDHNMWAWDHCQEIKCENCKHQGFPCANLAWYGFQNDFIEGLWEPNFVVGE
jgi:hypothetical protein